MNSSTEQSSGTNTNSDGSLHEYIDHYNNHRPHRSLHQRAPNDTADVTPIRPSHTIQRRTTCAGLINEYRAAA